MTRRKSDEGVVLINVLVVLAIAGGLMMLLITSQEAALDRVSRASDAATAEQIAMGAEASVVDALRRDLDTGPDTDHFSEPWARKWLWPQDGFRLASPICRRNSISINWRR